MKVLIGGVGIATLGIVLAACSSASDDLVEAIEATGGPDVSLAEAFDTDADSYLFLCPYESRDAMEDRLGFDWPEAPDYSDQDAYQGIAFVTGENVELVEISLSQVDLCTGDDPLRPLSETLYFTRGSDRWVLRSS